MFGDKRRIKQIVWLSCLKSKRLEYSDALFFSDAPQCRVECCCRWSVRGPNNEPARDAEQNSCSSASVPYRVPFHVSGYVQWEMVKNDTLKFGEFCVCKDRSYALYIIAFSLDEYMSCGCIVFL